MNSTLPQLFGAAQTAPSRLLANACSIKKAQNLWTLKSAAAFAGRLPALLLMLCCAAISIQAANPSAGTVGPSAGDYTHWYGTRTTAAASADESTCIEGVNCDTFKLTISGSPADWAGKHARLSIFWGVRTSDYDVYVHKGTNAGPLVAKSAHGAMDSDGVQEVINLDPATTGTGEYSIHVVYFAVTDSLYVGDVTVSNNEAPEPTPTPEPTPEPTSTPTPLPPPTPEPVTHDPSGVSCTLPGFMVAEDPARDSASGLGAHDFLSLHIAEPGNLINRLVFTVKVSDLSILPLNTEWRVSFEGFYPSDAYWVSMNTLDPLRGAVFYYGHYEYAGGERKSFTDGEADAGEYLADGTIRITVATGKFGYFGAGRRMYAPSVKIRAFDGPPFVALTGQMDTHGRSESYLVVGNLSCNYLPTVSINSPREGEIFTPGSVITINTDAADADGTVSRVEFFAGDRKLGESTAAPHRFDWRDAPVGGYTLTARATDNVGASAVSAPVRIEVRAAPPDAPADLSATVVNGIGKGVVALRWSDRSGDERSFHVERSTSSASGFVEIATVGAGVTTYADGAVQRKTTYYYRIRAGNDGGFSAYSNTAHASVK
ncbi:MAG TPA: Ig-like domain-containing protein [Pyrinomonadaceae bacterium]|nr:Ig-like domain-containing protein [Pyrinomonadaceae bacterium]